MGGSPSSSLTVTVMEVESHSRLPLLATHQQLKVTFCLPALVNWLGEYLKYPGDDSCIFSFVNT